MAQFKRLDLPDNSYKDMDFSCADVHIRASRLMGRLEVHNCSVNINAPYSCLSGLVAKHSSLTCGDLQHSFAGAAYFMCSNLHSCNFADATLLFFNANCSGLQCIKAARAKMPGAEFELSDLFCAGFSHADLRESTFTRCRLESTCFNGANLENAKFYLCDFRSAEDGEDHLLDKFLGARVRGMTINSKPIEEILKVSRDGAVEDTVQETEDAKQEG